MVKKRLIVTAFVTLRKEILLRGSAQQTAWACV